MFYKKVKDYLKKAGHTNGEMGELKESKYHDENIKKEIEYAKAQWEAAKNLFDNATEPDKVDYSIYLLGVYEKKLKILYKKLRNENQEE